MATKSIRLTDGTDTLLPESATSASGYQKNADGTLICWGRSRGTVSASSPWGGGYYGYLPSITFPVAFSETPTVTAMCGETSVFAYPVGADVNTTNAIIYLWRPNQASVTITINWVAIGRWK